VALVGRRWLAACVLLALASCLPACGPDPGIGRGADPDTPEERVAAPAPTVSAASVPFDAGPVETAAEYLAEGGFDSADLERGKLLALACLACHSLEKGGGTLVGPNLNGMFGRPAASLPGFDYSPALAASNLVWTPRSLERWLAEPQTFVVGTKMAFTGYRSASDRRDLIAYLLNATQ
jgi:cytochrome c